ncbi:MAG: alanine racemase [Thermoleophilaceae bacterium]
MVKADGYGHGAEPSARAALAGGASWLAVATAAEAVELRAARIGAPILVMGALTEDELEQVLGARAHVVAWETGFVERAAAIARALGDSARLHVKLDSGMGRLGLSDPEAAGALCDMIAADGSLELVGLMTHFATADEPGDRHFSGQLERFTSFAQAVRRDHPQVICHAANSAATLRDPAAHFDLVRCGIAIYGLDPFGSDPREHGLEPALSLESYVALVKRFEAGQSAGYGRTWIASEATIVGVLPIGYGDGYRRGLSNNADVLIAGRRTPLVGTVSMDNVTVELGSRSEVGAGDPAVLIGELSGERILCEELARRLDTINYEVTCGLGARVPRAYFKS